MPKCKCTHCRRVHQANSQCRRDSLAIIIISDNNNDLSHRSSERLAFVRKCVCIEVLRLFDFQLRPLQLLLGFHVTSLLLHFSHSMLALILTALEKTFASHRVHNFLLVFLLSRLPLNLIQTTTNAKHHVLPPAGALRFLFVT